MHDAFRRFALIPLLVAGTATLATAETTETSASETPIVNALGAVEADVLRFNDHLTTLASPYMGGRVPGSIGMERAKDYCQFWLEEFGLGPVFTDASGELSYRQELELGGSTELTGSEMTLRARGNAVELTVDDQYIPTALGASGRVTGEMVFVGYSVDGGPDGYTNYDGLDDLEGKIAVMFRFEPMDAKGESRFTEGSGWSNEAGFRRKLNAAFDRGAAGAIIINPPGSADERANQLASVGGGRIGSGPVVMLSQDGGEKLLSAADPSGRSLVEMRGWADTNSGWVELNGRATVEATFERIPLIAENVAGSIPGRGDLADEVIVIGAHLDHLGMGYFGSRSGPGELHAGADDNASGSAGVLLLAEKLKASYDAMPEDADLREIILVLFTGEESGLNGSRYMANNPPREIESHMLMINFDMIGRILNDRLSVSGMNTASDLGDWAQPFFDASELDVIEAERMSGASDHTSYYNAGVPVLFGIIEDFHSDYHTPADTSDKINRVGGTKTARLFHDIALAAAQRPERFEYVNPNRANAPATPRLQIKVRFGVQPSYEEGQLGILIEALTPGGAAGEAGVEEGDRLVRWDGQKIEDIGAWMEMLSKHEPGDEVKVGVLRGDEEITLDVTLGAAP